jgi:hypothetical protein
LYLRFFIGCFEDFFNLEHLFSFYTIAFPGAFGMP